MATPSRRTPLLIALTLALSLAPGCGSDQEDADLLQRVKSAGVIRVAQTQANPPWNFLENGKPAGYDVDVAHELARRLGIGQVEFVPSNFQNFIAGVQAGRFDAVISGQTITEERKKQVDFSRPYEVNGISIFVAKDSAAIGGVADLKGRTIAVTAGTTQAAFAKKTIPDAEIKTYDNATLGLTEVGTGRADAALVSRFQGAFLAEKNGLAVKPTGPLLESEVNGISFAKGSTAFKQAVDKALGDMIADGTLSAISKKWLGGLDMAAELKGV
ncbi:transporter substrate-binding domain-containing protein [Nonomuraea basaltis]|uniref:transporter substrate-binding domain-containing protein n=1 Tax=Nonomuraea basaltis TaxID=2495887 RepID=UPI00110C6AB0|nr:transporter substrate-binding domain-containing protein [Nonomuraea basaltis]TMR95744.1 transporter substrate-binding domain-containing protein [Nonomuraea basaltis]